jgi:hypothetical protein
MAFWFILFGFIVLVSAFIAVYKRSGFVMFAGAMIALIVTLCGVGFIGVIGGLNYDPDETYKTERINIVALSDNVGVSGRFFLGSGTVQSEMYYFYMTENNTGGKVMDSICSCVPVYEDEANNPYIITIHKRVSDPVARFFFITSESERTEIHIPPNSIQYNFNIDLE